MKCKLLILIFLVEKTALSFIHSNGLTSNDEYPYIGSQQICQEDKLHNPIVTLDAYGVLPTDAENFMAEAVESVGPIAVGFSVTDPSFLYYKVKDYRYFSLFLMLFSFAKFLFTHE